MNDPMEAMLAASVAASADNYFSKNMFLESVNPGMRAFALALECYRTHVKSKRPAGGVGEAE